MDSKQIKKQLLEAREAIKLKNFEVAKRICQELLNTDENNYNALVFYGYAAQEMHDIEEACAAFKKAINISPMQILAWQGLRAFYEKETPLVHKHELVDVYLKFLNFFKEDRKKQVNILHRLGLTFFKDLNDYSKAVDYLCDALEITGKELSSDNAYIWNTLFIVLSSQTSLTPKELEVLMRAFDKVLEGRAAGISEFNTLKFAVLENYFNLLLKEQHYGKIVEDVRKTLKFYPDNEFLFAVLIRAFSSSVIDGTLIAPDSFNDVVSQFMAEDNSHKAFYKSMLKGVTLFITKNWIEARDSFLIGLQLQASSWWEVRLLLCWTLEKFYDGIGVERFAEEGLRLLGSSLKECRRKYITCLFKLSFGKGLLFQGIDSVLGRVVCLLSEAAEDADLKSQALYFQGIAYLKMNKLEEVEKILKFLNASNDSNSLMLALEGLFHSKRCDFQTAKERLSVAEQLSPENDEWTLELANLHMKLHDHSTAYTYYLKAAKKNPCNPSVFVMLGHYYRNVSKDLKKSLQCYKYAFDLNNHQEEIGMNLSDMYQHLNDTDSNLALLQVITTKCAPGTHKWAFERLGHLMLRRNDIYEAVRSFQCALRCDPQNSECWQCLGEAYLLMGSHSNALKAFRRALEINPKLLYSIYQSANIKLSLGFFKEAGTFFNEVAQLVPNYVPALKGLGESYLAQAQTYLENSCSMKALSLCESTLLLLSRAIFEQADFICLWKLLGDACTLPGLMHSTVVKMQVPSILLNGHPPQGSDVVILEKLDVLKLGERFYLTAIRLSPHNASLWHDFGVNAYYQSLEHSQIDEKMKFLNRSLSAMKKSVSIKRENSFYWNALGVLASLPELKKYSLAQHSFIMSVSTDANNYQAWSNLGVLYLLNGNYELSNKMFAISQSIEPSYVNSWLGQAVIAENIQHAEAMDLFRHCTYIGTNVEGYIGYAAWVCSTLLGTLAHNPCKFNTNSMEAIIAASDCLIHYTDIVRDNVCAYNMLGLLSERCGSLQSAEAAFRNAIQLSVSDSEVTIADALHCNYARVLRKLGKFKLSIDEGNSVSGADFYNQYGIAASTCELSQVQESSVAGYVLAMKMASTNEEKSNLLVSMASISYQLRGPEEAKSLLFQRGTAAVPKPPCLQHSEVPREY